MGDKNPKKQKKKKRAVEKTSMAPFGAEQKVDLNLNIRPKNQSRGR